MSGSRGTGAPGARARPRRDAAPASCPLPCPLPGLPPRSRPCPPGCFRVYINKRLAAAGFLVLNKLRARARAQPGLHSRPQDRAVRGPPPAFGNMLALPQDPAQLPRAPASRGTWSPLGYPRHAGTQPPASSRSVAPQPRRRRPLPGKRNSLGRATPSLGTERRADGGWSCVLDPPPPVAAGPPVPVQRGARSTAEGGCPGSCCSPAPGKRPKLLN